MYFLRKFNVMLVSTGLAAAQREQERLPLSRLF
jgi:hypothetical protein